MDILKTLKVFAKKKTLKVLIELNKIIV